MDDCTRAGRHNRAQTAALTAGLVIAGLLGTSATGAEQAGSSAEVRQWPCRLVVRPTLLGVIEDGWKRSPTLRGQCEELARARAVVKLEWGKTDSQSRALSKLKSDIDGVVVADVTVPPVSAAVALVAHELEHVLERARGLDFDARSRIPGSGVWRAFGGFETQGAIDIERRVKGELDDSPRTK